MTNTDTIMKATPVVEDAIFHAAAVLSQGACECRGVTDPEYADRLMYHFAAQLSQIPLASGLSEEEIELRLDAASMAMC